MTKKRALLLIKSYPPMNKETEWNTWYHSKYLPDRLAIPGFLSARRSIYMEGKPKPFAIGGEPKYLTLFDLANANVLKSGQYKKLLEREASQPSDSFEVLNLNLPKLACGVYEQIYPPQGEYTPPQNCRFIHLVAHEVPRGKRSEFNAWYDTEHIPAMLRVPGLFATVRRFVLAKGQFPGSVGSLPEYLSVYDVENEKMFKSNVYIKETASPWSDWVRSWFTRKMCALYYLIYPEE